MRRIELLVLSKGPNAIKNFHVVDTRGLLKRAQLGHPGDSNDWQNEIHPNDLDCKTAKKGEARSRVGSERNSVVWLRLSPTERTLPACN